MLRLRSGLVDDDRVVGEEHPVALDLVEQDAVGHDLDQRLLADPVGEPDGVTNLLTDFAAQLLGHPLGHRPGRQPAGLGVADHAPHPQPDLEADLRQLRALPRPRLAGHDHDLVVGEDPGDLVLALADRQGRRVAGDGHAGPPVGDLLLGRLDGSGDLFEGRLLGGAVLQPPGAIELAPEPVLIPGHELGQPGRQVGERGFHDPPQVTARPAKLAFLFRRIPVDDRRLRASPAVSELAFLFCSISAMERRLGDGP